MEGRKKEKAWGGGGGQSEIFGHKPCKHLHSGHLKGPHCPGQLLLSWLSCNKQEKERGLKHPHTPISSVDNKKIKQR